MDPRFYSAEMAAKTALILGSQDGLKWIETRPELSALLVLETGDVISVDFISGSMTNKTKGKSTTINKFYDAQLQVYRNGGLL